MARQRRGWFFVVSLLAAIGLSGTITPPDGRRTEPDWSRREAMKSQDTRPAWEPEGVPRRPVVQPAAGTPPGTIERVLVQPQMRWPVVMLVDVESQSLQHARLQWGDLHALPPQSEFDIMAFNETRADGTRRAHGAAGVRRVLADLRGEVSRAGSAAFVALLQAAQRSPRGTAGDTRRCAVLLFTSRPAADDHYAAIAAREFAQRQCRLYVWWSGVKRFQRHGAESLFREMAEYTAGAFYEIDITGFPQPEAGTDGPMFPTDNPTLDNSSEANFNPGKQSAGQLPNTSPWNDEPYSEHSQVILTARQGLTGLTTTRVLVDSSVQDLFVYILGYVSSAYMRNPLGSTIYLLRRSAEAGGTDGAVTGDDGDGLLELRLNTRGVPPGVWELTADDGGGSTGAVTGEAPMAGYDVIVKGTSALRVNVLRANISDNGAWVDDNGNIVVTVHGEPPTSINNITDVVLLDNKGNEIRKAYYKERVRRDQQNREVYELTVPSNLLKEQQQTPYFVQVNGVGGAQAGYKSFSRITPQIPTMGNLLVSLNEASNLTINPGTQSQIYLDVTNIGSRHSRVSVYGSTSRKILYGITPNNFQLNANQKKTISLALYAPSNMNGFGDTVKIQVHGELTVTELYLELTIADSVYAQYDTKKPSFQHKILSNCKDIDSCTSKQWNMEATVEDSGSGIREVSSQPQGILWTPMVIGSKFPVTLKYRASCCDESVIITVRDLQNNIAQHTINVNYDSSGLSAGAIAGIVVGCAVLLIIIIVIISVIVCKKKKTHTFQTQQVPR